MAEARGQALAAERPVGGEAERRLALGERALLRFGEVEERVSGGGGLGDELLRHAVPDHRQKADLAARAADLLDDTRPLGGQVDDGDRHNARV